MSIVPNGSLGRRQFQGIAVEKNAARPARARWRLTRSAANHFAAHVDSVQAGSGAAFSLLPPENATGNFVKVVQRVPVKIVFDEPLPADHTIGPGLSVDAERAGQFVSSAGVGDRAVGA